MFELNGHHILLLKKKHGSIAHITGVYEAFQA